jgi:anthranilate synthase component 1
VVVDRSRDRTFLVAEHDPAQLEQLRQDAAAASEAVVSGSGLVVDSVTEDPPQRFLDGVEAVLDYLLAGDVFQVNLSRRWRGNLSVGSDYADLYARLRCFNPAPFAGLALWRGSAVLSSSPERLVSVADEMVQTRPIAGTRARRPDPEQDQAQRAALMESLKERAEHVMLIDLERNDLGRVCVPGSVEASELMCMESYAYVHHIVSNVRGRLRPGIGPGTVLQAVFPGGTITGCPKVRAMEIIAELERVGRGPYTGAMGYLSRCGRMDTNILIRSFVCEDGQVEFRAGAGIVADSNPQAELAETRAKARGMLLALGMA